MECASEVEKSRKRGSDGKIGTRTSASKALVPAHRRNDIATIFAWRNKRGVSPYRAENGSLEGVARQIWLAQESKDSLLRLDGGERVHEVTLQKCS